MDNCKRCGCDILKFIKDYERDEDGIVEAIDVHQCQECRTIHWKTDTHSSYEFFGREIVENNAAAGYATNYSMAVGKKN